MKLVQKEDQTILLSIGDEILEIKIRYSAKARRIRIAVNHKGEAELVLPKTRKLERAREFLISSLPWLKERKDILNRAKAQVPKEHIPIFGKLHKVIYQDSSNSSINVSSASEELIVDCPSTSKEVLIIKYLKTLILKELKEIIEEISAKHQFHYNKVSVKDSKTSWGVCSSRKNLTFCWRLIFAPKNIIRYVVIHELCHLKEMNHSEKFWDLVRSIDPKYLEHRRWLRDNTFLLRQYIM